LIDVIDFVCYDLLFAALIFYTLISNMSRVTLWIFISLIFSSFSSCRKESTYETANLLLADRVWYLEKMVTSSAVYSYRESSTFSFQLTSSSKSYRDADGINGAYEIVESAQGVWMHISSPGRVIESYKVSQLEKNHFVAEVLKNADLHILYFSVRP
jgi:hypothetical protein